MLINPNSMQPVSVLGTQVANTGAVARTVLAASTPAVQVASPVPGETSALQRLDDPLHKELQGAQPDPKEIDQVVTQAKEYIQSVRRDLSLNYDEETGLLVIKVIDKDTQEVVRQVPAEEILAFIQNMLKLTGEREGVLLKEKA